MMDKILAAAEKGNGVVVIGGGLLQPGWKRRTDCR
jgi:hypothetical protein